MATPAQIRANRANPLRSTDPRCETGRQITKFNALKHGLAATEIVIRGEDPAVREALGIAVALTRTSPSNRMGPGHSLPAAI